MQDKRKLTNEEIYNKTKNSRVLWYLMILFGISTVVLAVCSLIFKISPIYSIISLILEILLKKSRNKIKEELKK